MHGPMNVKVLLCGQSAAVPRGELEHLLPHVCFTFLHSKVCMWLWERQTALSFVCLFVFTVQGDASFCSCRCLSQVGRAFRHAVWTGKVV